MIIIHLRFDGGSAEEEHDIAHIASSIVARLYGGLFLSCGVEAADRAYNTRLCQDELRRKKISALSLPEKPRVTGPVNTQSVTGQWLISDLPGVIHGEMDNRLKPSFDSGNGDVPGKTVFRRFINAA